MPDPEDAYGSRRGTYLIGVRIQNAGTYTGSDRHETKFQPMLAVRWGRLRLSNSGASGLLALTGDTVTQPGASARIVDRSDFKLSASLRVTAGRKSGDDPRLAGLPEVRRTLRARLAGSYALGGGFSATASISQDLLNRAPGWLADAGLQYSKRLAPRTEMSVGVGMGWADARAQRSQFGVDAQAAQRSGYARYEPGSGLTGVSSSVGLRHAFTRHWAGFAGVGVGRLLGPSVDSPLVRRNSDWSANAGLAFIGW